MSHPDYGRVENNNTLSLPTGYRQLHTGRWPREWGNGAASHALQPP